MTYDMPSRRRYLPYLVFIAVCVVLSSIYLVYILKTIQANRKYGQVVADIKSSTIVNCFDMAFEKNYSLRNLIKAQNGSSEGFDLVADDIFQETLDSLNIRLKNIIIAPNGIVEKIYPLSGNERLLGFDYMDSSRPGNLDALAAFQKNQLIATNPFHLMQGGTGIAGRLPVFLEHNDHKEFWGLVSVTFDYADLLNSFHMESLPAGGYEYELWCINDIGQKISLSSSPKSPQSPVSTTVSVYNLQWQLDISPSSGWFNPFEIVVVVAVIFAFAGLMSALIAYKQLIQNANKKLIRLAHLDALTSCFSRQYVNSVLVNQISGNWNNPRAKYSIAIIDIDWFKSINDTFGHAIGDRALIAVATVLLNNCKYEDGDCVIRHGGDEFVLLMNDVTPERFTRVLKNIVEQVRDIRFDDYPDLHLSISVGGAIYESSEISLYYNALKNADEKLYLAKSLGRNQFAL